MVVRKLVLCGLAAQLLSGCGGEGASDGVAPVAVVSVAPTPTPSATASPTAQDQLGTLVSDAVRDYMSTSKARSLTVAVSLAGRRVYYTYSRADGATITDTSIIEIGSITKTFTATLLAMAEAEGLVAGSDEGRQFRREGDEPFGTCAGLMNLSDFVYFTSGLPDYPDNTAASEVTRNLPKDYWSWTQAQFVRWFSVQGTQQPAAATRRACSLPATYLYSNMGFGILGIFLARMYNIDWRSLVTERIAAPLGMEDTSVVLSGQQTARLIGGFSGGQSVTPRGYYPWESAGALNATPRDMLAYGEAVLGHASVNGRPVPARLAAALGTVQVPTFSLPDAVLVRQAMAWERRPFDPTATPRSTDGDSELMTVKNGKTNGFSTAIATDKGSDDAVFAVVNEHDDEVQPLVVTIVRKLHGSSIGVPDAARGQVIRIAP